MPSIAEHIDERSLLLGFQQGRSTALQYIYDIHYHSLWNFARKLIRDDGLAEDIVMEAYLKTWDKRGKFRDVKGIVFYLFSVARNACIDHIRLSNRRQVVFREIRYLAEKTTAEMEAELIRAELIQLAFLKAEEFSDQKKKIFMMIF